MTPYTVPSEQTLIQYASSTPAYMRPSLLPEAAVVPGWLSDSQCDAIIEESLKVEPYQFKTCGAATREILKTPLPAVFDPISDLTYALNRQYWNFDIDHDPAAWMQTYTQMGDYKRHTDGAHGQTRKLTAVALLSEPHAYVGGDLRLLEIIGSEDFVVPPIRGTVVVFMPWQPHQVDLVHLGIRQTINMGFWGPPFK